VESDDQKILLTPMLVKGKFAFENSPGFQAQIDDLGLTKEVDISRNLPFLPALSLQTLT
jgi:hypothetical protein